MILLMTLFVHLAVASVDVSHSDSVCKIGGELYQKSKGHDDCTCESALLHTSTDAYCASATLQQLCPEHCPTDIQALRYGRSNDCGTAATKTECLSQDNRCVWYLANNTDTNTYVGKCYAFPTCPIWMWGKGSEGQEASQQLYKMCQEHGISLSSTRITSAESCEVARASHNLHPWYDSYEGPCYSRVDATTTGDIIEFPAGHTHDDTLDASKILPGSSYCGVATCYSRLQKHNCTCLELIRYFEDSHVFNPCAAKMNEGENDPCVGTLTDHCHVSCQLLAISKSAVDKSRRNGLTQVGRLKSNVGKLLGLLYVPLMLLASRALGALISSSVPIVKLNEYLWCKDCTY